MLGFLEGFASKYVCQRYSLGVMPVWQRCALGKLQITCPPCTLRSSSITQLSLCHSYNHLKEWKSAVYMALADNTALQASRTTDACSAQLSRTLHAHNSLSHGPPPPLCTTVLVHARLPARPRGSGCIPRGACSEPHPDLLGHLSSSGGEQGPGAARRGTGRPAHPHTTGVLVRAGALPSFRFLSTTRALPAPCPLARPPASRDQCLTNHALKFYLTPCRLSRLQASDRCRPALC
jgi:hypothetical protein